MAELFVEKCKEIGVSKLLFIRHANANPINGASRSSAPHDWKFRFESFFFEIFWLIITC